MMKTRNMESIIRINFMVLLGSSGQVEIAIGVRSNMIANMTIAHYRLTMEKHTLGSGKMIREMAMVYLNGLVEQLITDRIKMINGKDMDSASGRMAMSMTASGKMATDQAWRSTSSQQKVSFKESSGTMTSASKL